MSSVESLTRLVLTTSDLPEYVPVDPVEREMRKVSRAVWSYSDSLADRQRITWSIFW